MLLQPAKVACRLPIHNLNKHKLRSQLLKLVPQRSSMQLAALLDTAIEKLHQAATGSAQHI